MRTLPRNWPASAPRGDYPVYCDYCGAKWRRSQLRVDADGKLRCPQEGTGMSRTECHRANAEASRALAARRAASRGDGRADVDVFPEVTITAPAAGTRLKPGGGMCVRGTARHGVTEVAVWRGHPKLSLRAVRVGVATLTGDTWNFVTPAWAEYGGNGACELYAVGRAGCSTVVSRGLAVEVS